MNATRSHLEAMEARLTARIDEFQAEITDRPQALEASIAALTEITQSTHASALRTLNALRASLGEF
jgi:hypothetical protein